MKELELNISSEIKWPQGDTVEVTPAVDFVYIMRKDGQFTMSPIASKFAEDYSFDEHKVKQTFLEEYDTFFGKLADIFSWSYESKGKFELHLFDPDALDKRVREKAGENPIVSLDPLMHQGVYQHKVSRGYYPAGKKDFGQVPRPGADSIAFQAQNISEALKGLPVTVAEDDIFSGGSLIASLTELKNNNVNVGKVIPGIQVGKPEQLSDMGILVDPVVEYKTTDGAEIFDKVDLGDPRDYLLGASGLVLKLPNGEYGRAPYVLPFVSSSARAGIPTEIEKEFAQKVLKANMEFFDTVEYKLKKPLLLKHMDESFVKMMHSLFGVDKNTPMKQVVGWAMENMNMVWETTEKQGELQANLEKLGMPKKCIFIDVNGTLIPQKSPDGFIPENDIKMLQETMNQVNEKGIAVGLCSDSPLPQLQKLAESLGIQGPIIAENGNIIFYSGQKLVLNTLSDIESLKEQIIMTATGYVQEQDCIAVEFGGKKVDCQNGNWAFGANRETSITVFGSGAFIKKLGEKFAGLNDVSVDCSPEYNYFAIHPGINYKLNKGQTLSALEAHDYSIMMIGDSMSDWVNPKTGVTCAFVADSTVSPEIKQKVYVSDQPLIQGVIGILNLIQK